MWQLKRHDPRKKKELNCEREVTNQFQQYDGVSVRRNRFVETCEGKRHDVGYQLHQNIYEENDIHLLNQCGQT